MALTMTAARAQTLAVRGETVYTMAGAAIPDGVVLIDGGKIVAVGPADRVSIPLGVTTLRAKVITPGLIDAHTVVGLSGYLNQPHDQSQLETSSAVQPELRAIDAYNPRERLIEWVRGFGVTTLHTGHGPGALVSGQTMVVKTRGETVEAAVFVPEAMVAATLGSDSAGVGGGPGTLAKQISVLRTELIRAKERIAKKEKPGADLRAAQWEGIIRGDIPLLVTAQRATEIGAALRLQKEFGFRLVLDGGAEAYLLTDPLKAAKIPVIVHPTMQRADGSSENLSFETATTLKKAGLLVALQSGYEGYVPKTRIVLFEAAVAAANGLSFEEALATITRDAAKLLGIDKRVGSLEVGKDADLALYDGDPFEYTTHCVGTVVDGVSVFDGKR
jgi:imidazolonepropionase-like amidohydrolase